jgi:hypothetical protein
MSTPTRCLRLWYADRFSESRWKRLPGNGVLVVHLLCVDVCVCVCVCVCARAVGSIKALFRAVMFSSSLFTACAFEIILKQLLDNVVVSSNVRGELRKLKVLVNCFYYLFVYFCVASS